MTQGGERLDEFEGLMNKRLYQHLVAQSPDSDTRSKLVYVEPSIDPAITFSHLPECRMMEHAHHSQYRVLDMEGRLPPYPKILEHTDRAHPRFLVPLKGLENAEITSVKLPLWFDKISDILLKLKKIDGVNVSDQVYQDMHLAEDAENIYRVNQCLDEIGKQGVLYISHLKNHLDALNQTEVPYYSILFDFFQCFLVRLQDLAYDQTICGLIEKGDASSRALAFELLGKWPEYFSDRKSFLVKAMKGTMNDDGTRELNDERFFPVTPLEAAFSSHTPDMELIRKLLELGAKPTIHCLNKLLSIDVSSLTKNDASMLKDLAQLLYGCGLDLYQPDYLDGNYPMKVLGCILSLTKEIEACESHGHGMKKDALDDVLHGYRLSSEELENFEHDLDNLATEIAQKKVFLEMLEKLNDWLKKNVDANCLREKFPLKKTHLHLVADAHGLSPEATLKYLGEMLEWGCKPDWEEQLSVPQWGKSRITALELLEKRFGQDHPVVGEFKKITDK